MNEDEIARAARLLKQNPAFEHALQYIRETALLQFEASSLDDDQTRSEARMLIDAAQRFRLEIETLAKRAK